MGMIRRMWMAGLLLAAPAAAQVAPAVAVADAGRPEADLDELVLLPGGAPPFQLGEGLGSAPGFAEAWANSDLPQIVTRFAEAACHRHRHLEKNLEKTEAKIRM